MLLVALLCGATAVVWVSGVRIIVIKPIGALLNGVTGTVAGLSNVKLLDSSDAICKRHEGGVSSLCRGREAAVIAEKRRTLFHLPYGDSLYRMTGAPEN